MIKAIAVVLLAVAFILDFAVELIEVSIGIDLIAAIASRCIDAYRKTVEKVKKQKNGGKG